MSCQLQSQLPLHLSTLNALTPSTTFLHLCSSFSLPKMATFLEAWPLRFETRCAFMKYLPLPPCPLKLSPCDTCHKAISLKKHNPCAFLEMHPNPSQDFNSSPPFDPLLVYKLSLLLYFNPSFQAKLSCPFEIQKKDSYPHYAKSISTSNPLKLEKFNIWAHISNQALEKSTLQRRLLGFEVCILFWLLVSFVGLIYVLFW